MNLPISITLDLVVLGGFASVLSEFLRGLILRIEDYPRLAKSWKYLPSFFGMIGILIFPGVAPGVSSLLMQLAYGAASPAVFYIAYPIVKKLVVSKTQLLFNGAAPTEAPALPPEKEGEK